MKRRIAVLVLILLLGLILIRISNLDWDTRTSVNTGEVLAAGSTSTPALLPTDTAVILNETTVTPERTLPPIGANAGLVLAATVLVLIIIGGVVFTSRRRAKH